MRIGIGKPLPRIQHVEALTGRRARIVWLTGEITDIDLSPALAAHRAFAGVLASDEMFKTATRDEYGDAIVWADGCELSATWIDDLREAS